MNFKRKNKTNRSRIKKENVKCTYVVPKVVRMLAKG
jgi:hypothetical protein